jgi:MoxR-like ATPase
MKYKKLFSPKELKSTTARSIVDQTEAHTYVFNDDITLAVNVSMATRRPLLVRGTTGTGKSSLAPTVAAHLKRRYLSNVISSRSEARDLLWTVDELQRLRDAHAPQTATLSLDRYIIPGVLWRAFDPKSAHDQDVKIAPPDTAVPPLDDRPAVVLLDEIDKADPDLPNNLLVPLGTLAFDVVPMGNFTVRAKRSDAPLIIITSNDERELPSAFLRRCVEVFLKEPDEDRLLEIGARHFPQLKPLLKPVLEMIKETRPSDWSGRTLPVPAEYIDALRAVEEISQKTEADARNVVREIASLLIWKPSQNVRL